MTARRRTPTSIRRAAARPWTVRERRILAVFNRLYQENPDVYAAIIEALDERRGDDVVGLLAQAAGERLEVVP